MLKKCKEHRNAWEEDIKPLNECSGLSVVSHNASRNGIVQKHLTNRSKSAQNID